MQRAKLLESRRRHDGIHLFQRKTRRLRGFLPVKNFLARLDSGETGGQWHRGRGAFCVSVLQDAAVG
jgi:hypothetical protein